MKDMARWLPQQLAAMKSAGMGATLDNFSSLLNANQLAFMTAGSTDEAGNNLVNLLAKISSQDIVTKAKKIDINGQEGFDFTASMNKRQRQRHGTPITPPPRLRWMRLRTLGVCR